MNTDATQEGNNMAVKQLTTADSDSQIASGKSIVDFSAAWCGPCQMLAPILEQASERYSDVKFFKVDIDSEPDLTARFKIMSVPMLIVFKDGQVVKKSVGLISGSELSELIKGL